MFKYGIIFIFISSNYVYASDGNHILREVDSFRLPDGSVRVETEVKLYRNDKFDKERHYTVYIKPPRRSLVLMKSPMEVGQKLLMLGEKFWLLTADSQRPLRITSSQKLLGEASTGDIANMTWSEDYTGGITAEVACPEFPTTLSNIEFHVSTKFSSCMQLNLKGNVESLTYSDITLYVDKNTKFPVKAELFVNSGKKLRMHGI
ncbi:MAG: outer membrane lipoprotein-sorting protein [Azoarcus sp.]|jgi:outer membrane lipoprotein-sorting protein|nr:outer membrane lipoprotein-sorting protein [Azoarcus sp.]